MEGIRIQNLVKIYNPKSRKPIKALDNVSLDIPARKIFALLGPNGAGKSTLFKILLGFVKMTSGEVKIFGNSIGTGNHKIGYLPEAFKPEGDFTALSFLRYFGEISKISGSELNRRIEEVLELVDLTSAKSQKIKTFSKGMLQRLLFAQAIIHQPELLLLDEPTDGLDPIGKRDFRNLLLKMKESNVTIILNSHLLSEVEFLADEVAILKAGKVVVKGSIMELLPKSQGFEIIVNQGIPENSGFNFTRIGDEFVMYVNDIDSMQKAIASLNDAGIKILMVRPVKNNLEEIFFHYIGDGKNV
jgi:ABC-2 type transport system ATP-binding protein